MHKKMFYLLAISSFICAMDPIKENEQHIKKLQEKIRKSNCPVKVCMPGPHYDNEACIDILSHYYPWYSHFMLRVSCIAALENGKKLNKLKKIIEESKK